MSSTSLIDVSNWTGPMAEKPRMWRAKKAEEAPMEEPRRMARIYAKSKKEPAKPKEGGRRSLYAKMGM